MIKSIPTQYLDKVELAVTQAIVKGDLSSELTKKIMEIGQSTENRAKLVARDQASKFNAALTQARHEDLGITHYRWSTSGDERVRESHIENDGKIFAYDDPPEETGHPGHDINCRCVAIPVLDKAEIEKAGQLAEEKDAEIAFYPDVYQFHIEELNEPLMKAEIEKYHLSMPEIVAIREYSANGFAKLNTELRANKPSLKTRKFETLLNRALDKLPNYEGKVWRDVDFPNDVLINYVVGNIITEKAFLSSSYDEYERFEKRQHRLLIHSKKGKKIENISAIVSENEVLFKSNSKFKVIKRIQTKDYLLIELQEI